MSMESINHVVSAIDGEQTRRLITEENSAATIEKAMMTSAVVIPPDDDDDSGQVVRQEKEEEYDLQLLHSRHTFSSRQKLTDAQNNQKHNKKSVATGKLLRKNNHSVTISPLADGANVRKGPSHKYNGGNGSNSDMKWSTIRNDNAMPTSQELDKMTSWLVAQPISPDCSVVKEEQQRQPNQKQVMTMVSPEARSHQKQKLHYQQEQLLSNFKTPKKTPQTHHQSKHAAVPTATASEETPITQLFNYYNFIHNTSNKENIKPISPTTSSMLQTSPFKSSCKLLDDQLQSVLKADRSMDRKLEQMMMANALDDSYMNSPASHIMSNNSTDSDVNSSGYLSQDETQGETSSIEYSENESRSTTNTVSDISDEYDAELSMISQHTSSIHHFRSSSSPSSSSGSKSDHDDVEFLTPKSRLVVNDRGRRTASTAYYTARNGGLDLEGNDDVDNGRMYDSDSEVYSIRRMDVMQLHQRPRRASFDATVSSSIVGALTTTNNAAIEERRRNSMSPPTEFRTTRVLWHDDTTPIQGQSLCWDQISSKEPLSVQKSQHQHSTNTATPIMPKQLHDQSLCEKNMSTISDPTCNLQLGRIAEEHTTNATVQPSDSCASSEREGLLLNVIKEMQLQITELDKERESLAVERDRFAKDCSRCKAENVGLCDQVKTLKENVELANETLASTTVETDRLKQILQKSEEESNALKATLVSRDEETAALSKQILLLTEVNDGLTNTMSSKDDEQRKAKEAAAEEGEVLKQEKHNLEETVADLTERLANESAKHTVLQGALEEKDVALSEAQQELLDRNTEIDNISLAKSELETKYAELLEENASLEASNSTLEKSNEAHEESLRHMADDLTELRRDLLTEASEKDENAQSLHEARNSIKLLEGQVHLLQSEVASANEEKIKMAADLDALVCLEEEAKEKLTISVNENSSLREEVVMFHSHLTDAKSEQERLLLEMKEIAQSRDELSSANIAFETRLSKLEAENRALTTVRNILQLSSKKFESLNASSTAELEKAHKEIEVLKMKNRDINLELDELKLQRVSDCQKIEGLATEKMNIETQLSSSRKQLDETSLSLEDTRQQIEVQAKTIASLHASVDSVSADRDVLEEKMEVLMKEKSDVELLLKSSHSERAVESYELQKKLQHLEEEKSDVEERLNVSVEEKINLQRRLDEAVTFMESMVLSLEGARQQLQCQSSQIESLQASVTSVTAKRDEVEQKMELLGEEKYDVEMQLKSTQAERDGIQQKFDEALVSCEAMLLSLEGAQEQIQVQVTDIKSLHASVSLAASDRDEVEKEMNALREEKYDIKSKLIASENERGSMQRKVDKTVEVHDELEKQIVVLQEGKADIEAQLNRMEMGRDILQRKFDEAVLSVRAQEEEVISLKDLLSSAATERLDLEKELETLVKDKTDVEMQLLSTQKQRDELQRKFNETCGSIEDTRQQLESQSTEIQSLKVSLASETAARAEVEKEMDALQVHQKSFGKERDDMQQRLDEALIQNESLEIQVQAQSTEIESMNASIFSSAAAIGEWEKKADILKQEKSVIEAQLNSTKEEHDILQQKFNEALLSVESMLLSLEGAQIKMQAQTHDVEELKLLLASREGALSLELSEKDDRNTSLVYWQALAAKLAVNVIQLKFKRRNECDTMKRLSSELAFMTEEYTDLEKDLNQVNVAESNLKLTVSNLASALVALKVRERLAIRELRTVSTKNSDLMSEVAVAIKEKEMALCKTTVLTDKITDLESMSKSHHSTIQHKDAEMKRLSKGLEEKDEALRGMKKEIEGMKEEMEKLRCDAKNGVEHLELEHARAIQTHSALEEELEGVKTQLNREKERVSNLQCELEQVTSENDDAQAALLCSQRQLEEVRQDRSHLKAHIEDMHDSIAALEADKQSLTLKLEDFQEQADHLSKKIAELESEAKSNAKQIDYMEFQLVSRRDESEVMHKMIASHEATLKALNDEIEMIDSKKSDAEESLSSLHSKMDAVINERDGLAMQLESTVHELRCARAELDQIKTVAVSPPAPTPREEDDASQEVDDLSCSPGQAIRKILESSKISREDIDHICANMDKAKAIVTQIGKERKTLKKEVKRLRLHLERAQGELTTVKKDCNVMEEQTIALRSNVSKVKSLLKESQTERNQLASDLEKAHKAMQKLQRSSSESHKAIVQQSQYEISMLRSEIESKDEAIEQLRALHNEHISKFDITSESVQESQQLSVSEETLAESVKVEKGKYMFGLLNGKRSKRKSKDQLSYRKTK